MDIDSEEWRPVVGFEEWYEVSNLGRVRTWRSKGYRAVRRADTPKVVSGEIAKGGYIRVKLTAERRVNRPVHVLVLEAFVGPRPAGYHACHNNGVPSDNVISNLRWDTVSNNMLDKARHGH